MPTSVKFEEIDNKADSNRYYFEECVGRGLLASIFSYAAGAATIPFVWHKFGRKNKYVNEYSILFGAISWMFVSYFVGQFVKNKYANKIKSELYDLAYKN